MNEWVNPMDASLPRMLFTFDFYLTSTVSRATFLLRLVLDDEITWKI